MHLSIEGKNSIESVYQNARIAEIKSRLLDPFGNLSIVMKSFITGCLKDMVQWKFYTRESIQILSQNNPDTYKHLSIVVDLINVLKLKSDKEIII